MKKLILDHLNHITMGDKQTYKNIVVFPLLCNKEISVDYILLDEAIESKQIVITEESDDGIAAELMVENLSGENILILDGERLVGARQNRAANTTILIPAHSVVTIPISCIERKRWHYQGQGIMNKDRVTMRRNMAANESLMAAESFQSDQGEVRDIWGMVVNEEKTQFHVDAPTCLIEDFHEHEQKPLDEYVKHFSVEDSQVGVLVLIDNHVMGCDCFGRYDTLRKNISRLIKSYAPGTIDTIGKKCTFSKRKAADFINNIRISIVKGRTSISLGTDLRLESQKVTGSALSIGKELIHFSAFVKEENDSRKKTRFFKSISNSNLLNVSAA